MQKGPLKPDGRRPSPPPMNRAEDQRGKKLSTQESPPRLRHMWATMACKGKSRGNHPYWGCGPLPNITWRGRGLSRKMEKHGAALGSSAVGRVHVGRAEGSGGKSWKLGPWQREVMPTSVGTPFENELGKLMVTCYGNWDPLGSN